MTTFQPLRALNCPNCGAPVQFAEDENSVRCAFCGSVMERSNAAPTPDETHQALKINWADGQVTVERPVGQAAAARRFTIKMQDGQPIVLDAGAEARTSASFTSTTFSRTQRPATGGGNWVGCLVAGIIVSAVLLPFIIILATTPQVGAMVTAVLNGDFGTASKSFALMGTRINIGDSVALIPALNDAPPDILTLATVYPADDSESTRRLALLSGAAPKLMWLSAPLDKDTYSALLLADREQVYTVNGTRLLALRRADGAPAWESALADKITPSLCPTCLRLLTDRIAALTDDGTLQVFDTRTGKALWHFRARQDSPRGLYVLNGQLAFVDQDKDNRGLLRVFNPADGAMRTLTPECKSNSNSISNLYWYTPLYPSTSGAEFYLAFGSYELCLQRWDAKALTLTWETKIPNVNSEPAAPPLITNDAIALTFGHKLIVADAAGGQARTLAEDADYELVPVAVQGKLLIARARRTRGSTRYSLWALDKTSGERKWEFDLGANEPLDPPNANTSIIDSETSVWTLHPTPAGLVVLRFWRAANDTSHAVISETLDWQTGASGGQQRVPLGVDTNILSAPTLAGWTNTTVWFSIEQTMLELDTTANKIIYRWP